MNKKDTFLSLLIFLSFAFYPSLTYSLALLNPASSAGVVEREIEREYEARPISPYREIPYIELDLPEEQLQLPEGKVTVAIHEISITGNTVFETEALQSYLQCHTGKCLCMADIGAICLSIQELYVKNGFFLARAFPPPQRIDGGILHIQIVEGYLGSLSIEGNCHYPTYFIERYFGNMCGLAINYNALVKALMLLNENSDLKARAVFVKGQSLGYADLAIVVEDERPSHLLFNANNFGTHGSTRWRTGARLDHGNFLTPGDNVSIAGVCGYPVENLKFVDVIYDVPLNQTGDSVSVAYLYSDSKVNEFKDLRLGGKSEVATFELRHAMKRSIKYSSDAFFAFEAKEIYNYALGHMTTYDKLRILSGGLDYDGTDKFGARNLADMSVSIGIPDILGGSHAVDSHASRTGSGGRFVMFNADLTRLQPLPCNQLFVVNFSGQIATSMLPLPQQFYIGGANTVRGYSMAAALGDDGYFLNLEYRFPPIFFGDKRVPWSNLTWGECIQMVTFIDNGGVYLKRGRFEDQNDCVSLTGCGVGLRIHAPYGLEIDCDVGVPLTRQEKTTSAFVYLRLTWSAF